MSQSLQVACALLFWYFPGTHGMQDSFESNPGVAPYFPAAQLIQFLELLAAVVVEYFPAAQFLQVVAAVALVFELYFPLLQLVQAEE